MGRTQRNGGRPGRKASFRVFRGNPPIRDSARIPHDSHHLAVSGLSARKARISARIRQTSQIGVKRTLECIPIHDCPKHASFADMVNEEFCGCPATTRRKGYLVFRYPTHARNWVVWDCSQSDWVAICGDWQTAMNTANRKIAAYLHKTGKGDIRVRT